MTIFLIHRSQKLKEHPRKKRNLVPGFLGLNQNKEGQLAAGQITALTVIKINPIYTFSSKLISPNYGMSLSTQRDTTPE